MRQFLFYISVLFCTLLTACNEEIKPDLYPPTLELYEAKDITRTSAVISGSILLNGSGKVSDVRFIYATDPEYTDAQEIKADTTEGYVEAELTALKAGQSYYYSLKAGNGYNSVQTPSAVFSTRPNSRPAIESVGLVYKGPFSAAVRCKVTHDGGEPLTALGFEYQKEGETDTQFISATSDTTGAFQARLSGLEMNATYRVWAHAANTIGDTNSVAIEFSTDNAIYMSTAGMLPQLIMGDEKYKLSSLVIAGEINGTDLRHIRDMAGRDYTGKATPGVLSSLNIADARIVSGGMSYAYSRYSVTDTLGFGCFSDCSHLETIVLPNTLKTIQANTFRGCTGLTSLAIPDSVVSYLPSEGCIHLEEIKVSPLNTAYSAENGILYDKKKEVLLQFPEGKMTRTIHLPATIRKLSDYSLQRCQADTIIVPSPDTELGREVFRNSPVKYIELSVENLPTATFQGCALLQTVVLGDNLKYISDYCFDQCNIKNLYIASTIPPACSIHAFKGSDMFSRCTLYVPWECKFTYRQNAPWENFSAIEEVRIFPSAGSQPASCIRYSSAPGE